MVLNEADKQCVYLSNARLKHNDFNIYMQEMDKGHLLSCFSLPLHLELTSHTPFPLMAIAVSRFDRVLTLLR